MPEFTAAWVLPAILVVLPIRWLHRYSIREAVQPVSALFLWQGSALSTGSDRRRQQPDPAWRRRALIAALLVLALAGPRWPRINSAPLPVLFDDGLSMHTREDHIARRRMAVDRLLMDLDRAKVQTLELRPLRADAPVLLLQQSTRPAWRQTILEWLPEPAIAPPRNLPAGNYWLVSDGADRSLPEWLHEHPPAHIVAIGSETENLAVTRLGIRPSVRDPERWDGLVEVYNAGLYAARAQLDVSLTDRAPDQILEAKAITIEAGARLRLNFSLATTATALQAVVLRAGEALTLDDRLHLDLTPLVQPIQLRIVGDCGAALRTAVLSHPRLRIVTPTEEADLTLACSAAGPATQGPVLRLSSPLSTRPPAGPVYWTREAGELRRVPLLAAELVGDTLTTAVAGTPLLMGQQGPLIVYRDGAAAEIRVLFDLDGSAMTLGYRLPILLAGLLDRLLGRNLLGELVTVHRDPAASHIAPGGLGRDAASPPPPSLSVATTATDLSPYLLWAALLVLLADVLLLVRGRSRLAAGANR